MFPEPFALERFFARHEFSARYLLSTSDSQGMAVADLIGGADEELRALWDHLHLGYTDSQGLPELREAIAALYESAEPDEVLVAAPEELIFLAMNALLEPGDHVICTFPGYQSLYELARGIGCEVSLWQPSEGETWRFDPADLEALLRPGTKLVVWNFPHNPTGALPPQSDYDRMVAAAERAGAWVFSDEMYRLLEPVEEVRLPAAVDLYAKAVSLSGMSKAFGLAGVRIGWVVTHDRPLLDRMMALKDYTTICSSAPSELLALMALRSREAMLAANRERVLRNRETAAAFFARRSDTLTWIPPQAGTVCFFRLVPDSGRAGAGDATAGASTAGGAGGAVGAEAFCARVLQDTGVLLLPSTVYDYGDSHFRMGLGRDDFAANLAVLDAYLASRDQA